MAEHSVIADVRAARARLDSCCPSFADLAAHLAAVQEAYTLRTGEFAGVPDTQPPEVRAMIAQSQEEPGGALLNEIRSTKPR